MPSLKQIIALRQAESPRYSSCDISFKPCTALLLQRWRGEACCIPWSRLARVKCASNEPDASVELVFDGVVVVIRGHNLAGLVEKLGAFEVECLRELPAEYRATMRPTEPFVAEIDIRSPA